ncbi:AGAP006145-PA [Anopheles gambiae str. PEST]|uniref:AGAP006145-PA n=2 Tax=gambiae species complex TaxID=44542 RepID=Q7Q5X9_ANOGA|nr:cuticle protein-like [Anopheles coluzzii]XP_316206.2 cuticle protein-like [Anopheles gambiae]EAA11848.2 AGAP006145-PA [Anopheles gambiae str. PEST]
MFRLVVLSVVLAVAAAAPGAHLVHSAPLAYSTVVAAAPALVAQKEISYQKSIVEEPTVAHVGTIEKSVPTGYSHQSFTQYHNKQVAEPVFAPAVKKTVVSTPVEKTTYVQAAAPVVHAAPAVYAAPVQTVYAAAPVAKTYAYAAPVEKTYTYAAAPAAISYEAAPVAYAAPLKTSYVSSYPSVYAAPAVYAHDY